MSVLSSDRIAAYVNRERAVLDQTFGPGQYEIEDIDRDEAKVRSVAFEVQLVYDRNRARDVGTYITLFGVPEELSVQNPLDTWASFLGEEIPLLPRNGSGIITVPPDEQVRNDLKWVARFAREIFSDPQTKRDAAYFALGYDKAYNDWASGKGSWGGPD